MRTHLFPSSASLTEQEMTLNSLHNQTKLKQDTTWTRQDDLLTNDNDTKSGKRSSSKQHLGNDTRHHWQRENKGSWITCWNVIVFLSPSNFPGKGSMEKERWGTQGDQADRKIERGSGKWYTNTNRIGRKMKGKEDETKQHIAELIKDLWQWRDESHTSGIN